jgi:hypothetical protein
MLHSIFSNGPVSKSNQRAQLCLQVKVAYR